MPPDLPVARNVQAVLDSDDPTYYPYRDEMGESGLQNAAARLLVELLGDYLRRHGRPAVVGSNQFFYYRRGDPQAVVSPDFYIIDGETLPQSKILSWKVWERGGKAPTLALEIVSETHTKDYSGRLMQRYEGLGVRELLRWDPHHLDGRQRQLLAHFVRSPEGRLEPHPTRTDRTLSTCYDGLWFVALPDDTLRIATGPDGATLWPTAYEREAAAEAQIAAARTAAETQVAAAEAQIAAAEARARAAEAELARLRGR